MSSSAMVCALAVVGAASDNGLTLTRFGNTAVAGNGSSSVVPSLESISDCEGNCNAPSSLLITGRIAPPKPGNYGFNVTFDPPLPYPSEEAYARLWVHDHLLFPLDTCNQGQGHRAGGMAPLWIPLPPRALDAQMRTVEHAGAVNLSSYEFRLEYICLAAQGCGARKVTVKWTTFDAGATPEAPYSAIPSNVLLPKQSESEASRRALSAKLQNGWGTFYHPSMLTWVLLPESFAVKVGLFRQSTGKFLSPEGLTINPVLFHSFAIRAGLHSYDNSFIKASLTWREDGDNLNVSIATTVDKTDSSKLTMLVTVNNDCDSASTPTNASAPAPGFNCSDFLLMLVPAFVHGRGGKVRADHNPKSASVSGTSAGLRTSTVTALQGSPTLPTNTSALPATYLGLSLGGGAVVLATDTGAGKPAASVKGVVAKTDAYRAAEAATLAKYGAWAEVKDAMQSSLMWSFMYDPKEGLVAPVTRNWGFSKPSIDGDQSEGLFCWDGSFASYMLSLDALDLSFSNLVQIVKMRTSAGFIPSYSSGTLKSRDRSNPPVTAKILYEITKRWGVNRTKWAVELCFDDLLNWNTWMFSRRRESPLGLLSWGSNPYPYAPDGTGTAARGTGEYGANLESGLDNGPVMEGVPFNETGLYLEDEYDVGYTAMYLMDCQAQIQLARIIGRTDAATTLQARFDAVNTGLKTLWNASAGYYQNKLSATLAPVERMAPTHFYPLLIGPDDGPTEAQAATTIRRHMTNPARFAVWETAEPPTDHPVPPEEARPLIQWQAKKCDAAIASNTNGSNGGGGCHVLCCQLICNFKQRSLGSKLRYEGMGLATASLLGDPGLTPLYDYNCSGRNTSDITLGPAGWQPSPTAGGPCEMVNSTAGPSIYVYTHRTGPSVADLVELEMWYKAGDHYVVASEAGKADAASAGYTKLQSLGFVWPPPGTANATSRYPLPSISKDDKAYIDQNYWHGRIWSPMIQIVKWGLERYTSAEAKGALAGLVAQSKALLMKEWHGYGGNNSYAGSGRYVYENFGADTGEGYGYSSEAQPMYSWGALAGFIGLQKEGFYDPL